MNDPLVELPGYVLRRASGAAASDLHRRLDAVDLRQADFAFMAVINRNPGITQSEAGRILDIKRANMVAFAARLEERKLLSRKRADGRSQALTLTARGRATLEKAHKIVLDFEADLVAGVPESMRPMVLPVLTALWNGCKYRKKIPRA